jgi:putative transcriptional regulator
MTKRDVREEGRPFKFYPDELARLEAMTDEEVEAAALSDPDNPPLADAQLTDFMGAGRLRRIREGLGISQEDFARRYHFSLGRLRDLEQGRTRIDGVLSAYLRLIEADPEFVNATLNGAADPGQRLRPSPPATGTPRAPRR